MTLGALDGFFSWRFAMTHKFMPAGLFSLLSFGMFLLFFWGIKKKAAGPTRH